MKKETYQLSELFLVNAQLKDKEGKTFIRFVILYNNELIAFPEESECLYMDISEVFTFSKVLEEVDLNHLAKRNYTRKEIQAIYNAFINMRKIVSKSEDFWPNVRIRVIASWWTLELEALINTRDTALAQQLERLRECLTAELYVLYYGNMKADLVINAKHPCLLKAINEAKINVIIPDNWQTFLKGSEVIVSKGEKANYLCHGEQITKSCATADALYYEFRIRKSDFIKYGYNCMDKVNNIGFNNIRYEQYRYLIAYLVSQWRDILEDKKFYYQKDLSLIKDITQSQITRSVNHVYLLGVLLGLCPVREEPNHQEQQPSNMRGFVSHYEH